MDHFWHLKNHDHNGIWHFNDDIWHLNNHDMKIPILGSKNCYIKGQFDFSLDSMIKVGTLGLRLEFYD